MSCKLPTQSIPGSPSGNKKMKGFLNRAIRRIGGIKTGWAPPGEEITMPPKYSNARRVSRKAKLSSAKKMMQGFRDILNSNPNRKGAKLPRVR